MPKQRLLERELLFVDAFMAGPTRGNATKSAIAAGYAPGKSAEKQGHRLRHSVKIRQEIDARQAIRAGGSIADAAELDERLTQMIRDPATHGSIVVRAIHELNKCAGRHLERVEHSGAVAGPTSVVFVWRVDPEAQTRE